MTNHDHTGSFPDAPDEHSTSAEVADAAAAADVASNAAPAAKDAYGRRQQPAVADTVGESVDAMTASAHERRWVEQAADLVVNDGDHPQPGHDNVANEHCGQNVAARLTKENL